MSTDILINGPVTTKIISDFIGRSGARTDAGGLSLFLGQVRADENSGRRVAAIEYSAYETMVTAEAEKIKDMILSEFDDTKSVEIVHSTGLVKAGEISLFVLVAAGHRQQAVRACAKAVELIKEKLPVWKKEIFDDDSHHWRQNDQI